MVDVLCIGTVAYDINIPLDSFPEENTKVHMESTLEEGGGPASNAAYLLSKWGTKCAFAGLIGDDIYGRRIMEEFKSVNTDICLISRKINFDTPLSIIMVNKQNGSRTILSRRNKSVNLELDLSVMRKMNPKVLLFDGHELEASLIAMEMYPRAKTVLDAGSLRKGTEVLAGKVDYLVSSERFALAFTRLPNLKTLENQKKCIIELSKLNRKQAVVTLGENGLIYEHNGKFQKMDAYPADTVDTTGAGDIFHGAFAYGVSTDMSLIKTLKFASMAASISVSLPGGRQSTPSIEQVRDKLKYYEANH